MLRDLIRNISIGINDYNFKGLNVGVVDERGEIAALYKGIPQNDVGIKTDVLENISKSNGIKMLIRSMAPQVVAADEIGTPEDIIAIKEAVCSGVKGIFTAHGGTREDLIKNKAIQELIDEQIIERIIFLKATKEGRKIQVEEKAC